MKRRLFSLIFLLIFVLSVMLTVGCDCSSCQEQEFEPFEDTGIVLADDGVTDYKIVIPENATKYEQYAADEMVLFFKQSTGATLQVITDSGLSFNQDDSYFSIGETTIYKESGVVASFDELGTDGYKVATKGKTVILIGGGGYGHINAVYGFLDKEVDYAAYAPDEVYVREVDSLNLLYFDWTDVPDFAIRAGGHYYSYIDQTFATRQRTLLKNSQRLFQTDSVWGLFAHTHFHILPKAQYETVHPEWYNANKSQLCLSQRDMWDEFAKNLKSIILADTDAIFYNIGHEDNNQVCNCETCEANRVKYGGQAGLNMVFANYIADEIGAWQKEVCPDRDIRLLTFAYGPTKKPPVVQNEDGSYSPICEEVIARDNLIIFFAPDEADYSNPYNDIVHNEHIATAMEGWKVCAKRFAFWGYCTNFSSMLEYFDNISAIARSYQALRDMGTMEYFFDESDGGKKQAHAFQPLMGYLHAQLAWDADQDVLELIDDFMIHYYKEAAEYVKEYRSLVTNFVSVRRLEIEVETGEYTGIEMLNKPGTLLDKDFWNKQVLEQMLEIFDKAYEVIDTCYTGAQRDKMLDRLKTESLTPRFYLIHLYNSEINNADLKALIDEFESDALRIGMTALYTYEGTIEEDIAGWRAKLNQ